MKRHINILMGNHEMKSAMRILCGIEFGCYLSAFIPFSHSYFPIKINIQRSRLAQSFITLPGNVNYLCVLQPQENDGFSDVENRVKTLSGVVAVRKQN